MSQFVELSGGPVEYRLVRGDPDRPPLVFLHEGLGSIELWRGFPDAVREAVGNDVRNTVGITSGVPTTLVTARYGHGRSAPAALPRPVDYMHREADEVLPELLAALGVERPVLIGHSDGASIALLYAGSGGAVAGLVAIAPHVFVEPESVAGIEAARTTFETTDLASRLARYHTDPEATFRGWNDVWLSEPFRAWNIEDRLSAIDAPLLLVQGTDDQYGTLAQLDAIERGVAGPVERFVVEGAGHSPHLDAHDAVVAAVAEFLNRVGPGRVSSG